ncbi:hypothetical protein BKA70DRAFT_1080937, partial [Coprinopsis sp. MPI-PUGE-AT-0042]
LCVGIPVFMVIDNISTYLTMPQERRKGYLRFLVFSGFILAASSISLAFDICVVFRNLFTAGPDGRSYIEAYRRDAEANTSTMFALVIAGGAMADLTITSGDILLLWRCVIMWSSKRWVITIPSLACTGVSRITYTIMLSKKSFLVEGPAAVATMVAESLSVSMKVMVTSLILFQLSSAWSLISNSCPSLKRPRTYSNVAAILIESAAPLAIFGVSYIIVMAIDYHHDPVVLARKGELNALNEVSASLYFSFSALSPQMIIFRVLNGRSWKNARESNEGT